MDKQSAVTGSSVDALNGMATLGKTAVSLLLIVGLILLLSYVLRRLNSSGRSSNQLLKQVASASLGPRERVVVLEFNDTWLVLGVGGGQITKLHEAPAVDSGPTDQQPPQAASFANRLAGLLHPGTDTASGPGTPSSGHKTP